MQFFTSGRLHQVDRSHRRARPVRFGCGSFSGTISSGRIGPAGAAEEEPHPLGSADLRNTRAACRWPDTMRICRGRGRTASAKPSERASMGGRMADVIYRVAGATERPAVAELWRRVESDAEFMLAEPGERAAPMEDRSFEVVAGGDPLLGALRVAVGRFRRVAHCGHLVLGVLPSHRGQGIGRSSRHQCQAVNGEHEHRLGVQRAAKLGKGLAVVAGLPWLQNACQGSTSRCSRFSEAGSQCECSPVRGRSVDRVGQAAGAAAAPACCCLPDTCGLPAVAAGPRAGQGRRGFGRMRSDRGWSPIVRRLGRGGFVRVRS